MGIICKSQSLPLLVRWTQKVWLILTQLTIYHRWFHTLTHTRVLKCSAGQSGGMWEHTHLLPVGVCVCWWEFVLSADLYGAFQNSLPASSAILNTKNSNFNSVISASHAASACSRNQFPCTSFLAFSSPDITTPAEKLSAVKYLCEQQQLTGSNCLQMLRCPCGKTANEI